MLLSKSRKLSFVFALLLLSISVNARVFFVAVDGSDVTGTGTKSSPFKSLLKAQEMVQGGDTVYLRGGVYRMKQEDIHQYSGIWAYQHHMSKSGSSVNKRINYWAYPGERPIIDMSDVKPSGYRIIAFYVSGSFLHFKGLEIVGTQVTIREHTQSECIRNDGGNHNIYEQIVMRDGQAIGFYLFRGSHNLVLNCDAFNNWDFTSQNGRGGNVDGFGFHGRQGSVGNVFEGCRAWFNSDDGFDTINSSEAVTIRNCWAFYNGFSTDFVSLADGNGFKIGGYGLAPVVSRLPNPIPSNLVVKCLAYRNKANGFYANHHVEAGNYWYHNSAYRNSTNFNMLSQRISKSIFTGRDTTISGPGIGHVLHNNVSLRFGNQRDTLNMGTSEMSYNSFTPGSRITVTASDFLSTDGTALMSPRKADGSLPDIDFMHLKSGSQLIDKGKKLGLPYEGEAPDLGAFEYKVALTDVQSVGMMKTYLYPNPTADIVYFSLSPLKEVKVVSIQGKMIVNFKHIVRLDVSSLPRGLFNVIMTGYDGSSSISKLVKL